MSEQLSELLARCKQTLSENGITIFELVSFFKERAIGLLLLLMALPNALLLASIPGISSIFGFVIVFLSFNIILNRKILLLPKKISRYSVSKNTLITIIDAALPWIVRIEKKLSMRWTFIFSSFFQKIVGSVILFAGICIALPIPFGNFLPGVCLVMMALGLIIKDGALVVGGLLALSSVLCFLMYMYKWVLGVAFEWMVSFF
jgi:hypothetical protein